MCVLVMGVEKKKSCAFGPPRERDRADDCLASMGASREESVHILHTYSTVFITTVFPASSETIENVLSDRKRV